MLRRAFSVSLVPAALLWIAACSSSPNVSTPAEAQKQASAVEPTLVVPQEISFALKGQPVKKLTLEQMKKISPAVQISITEPHMKVKKTYEAVALIPILDSVYGKKWRTSKDVEFTCRDGYKPIYSAKFYSRFPSHLAFREVGTDKFEITKPLENNKVADLAPFYVVWDYAKYPEAEKMGVVRLDLSVGRH